MQIGLISLVQETKHKAPEGHPENPARMKYALDYLISSDIAADIRKIQPQRVDINSTLDNIHARAYINRLKAASSEDWGRLDPDTYISQGSYEAAMETAMAAAYAADLILSSEIARIHLAGRPPGHHAERDRGMGFCLINNAAVAAEYACQKFKLRRIAIVDWDAHHGNGTQHIFYDRADVYYFSLHRYPFYPGSGASAERGTGRGEGFTLNLPLPGGTDDSLFIKTFESGLIPELEKYRPEFIIIISGFDAHIRDPLGGMELSEDAFGKATEALVKVADRYSSGRILSLFEGGYSPEGNALSLYRHIKELQK
jgi:acetoin utilization deacetylase AcuC-like enzyme